jgi:hypothetical protein
LFVYWTPDGYNTGAYNTANFVVKNQPIVPGAPLTTISTAGGQQWELEMTWQLSNGNWWLYVNQQVVGYFPGTLFGGGPLATGASEVDCGGETYSADGAWPPMGSGQFASSGGGNAAYQRDVEYFLRAAFRRLRICRQLSLPRPATLPPPARRLPPGAVMSTSADPAVTTAMPLPQ